MPLIFSWITLLRVAVELSLATWLFWLETIPNLVPLALHIISNEGEWSVAIIKCAGNWGALGSWKAGLVQSSCLFSSWAPAMSNRTLLLVKSGVSPWSDASWGTWGHSVSLICGVEVSQTLEGGTASTSWKGKAKGVNDSSLHPVTCWTEVSVSRCCNYLHRGVCFERGSSAVVHSE